MKDDFTLISNGDYWTGWGVDDPLGVIRTGIEECLRSQQPAVTLLWARVVEAPKFVTAGPRSSIDPRKIIVRRVGVSVAVELQITAGVDRELLAGAFTWVSLNPNSSTRVDQAWLDLGATLPWAADELKRRVYSIAGSDD